MAFINQKKINLVNKVFSSVNKKYDIMNDIMSLGAHRIWKRDLVEWMSPNKNDLLIDVASGSGDVAKIFSETSASVVLEDFKNGSFMIFLLQV